VAVNPGDLALAAASAEAMLRPALDHPGWDRPAGELAWSCRRTLDHVTDSLLLYSTMLATRTQGALPAAPRNGDPAATLGELLTVAGTSAAVLADVVRAAPPDARAFHPAGVADVSGFVGMGCDELLVHTGDIADGLGLEYEPPADLCDRVLRRLFPWAPEGAGPWATLRWANGRAGLPGHDRQDSDWYWHCAPLAEWDGTVPHRHVPPRWR
jgi:hypothetical protein